MHTHVATVLLRMAGLDALEVDPEPYAALHSLIVSTLYQQNGRSSCNPRETRNLMQPRLVADK
jgi:hypothetical protein